MKYGAVIPSQRSGKSPKEKGVGSAGPGEGLLCFSSIQAGVNCSLYPLSVANGKNATSTIPRPWKSFEAEAWQMSHPCMWLLLQRRDGLSFLPQHDGNHRGINEHCNRSWFLPLLLIHDFGQTPTQKGREEELN